MEQVIFGGNYNLLHNTDTEYNSLVGGRSWNATENIMHKMVSTDGVIKNLRVRLNASPGGTDKYTFTLMLNGAPTALTLDIIGAATTGSDMVNEITVTGGDYVCLRCVPTDTPTARYATWTSVFEGDTANESLILGGSASNLTTTVTEYGQVMGANTLYSGVENDFRQIVPTAGTIKDLYVKLTQDPGDTGVDGYKFTLRRNGLSQTLTVTIMADNTTGNDVVNSFAVVAGQTLTMMVEEIGSCAIGAKAAWGMTFVSTIDGESIVLGGSTDGLDNALTEYHYLTSSESELWTINEPTQSQLGQVCTLKKLYITLTAAPGAGNTYTFTIRIAGADSNVVTILTGAAAGGNSGALEDTVANDEYVNLKVVPDDTPNAADAYWGFVVFRQLGWSGKISGVTDPQEVMGVAKADIAEVKGVA